MSCVQASRIIGFFLDNEKIEFTPKYDYWMNVEQLHERSLHYRHRETISKEELSVICEYIHTESGVIDKKESKDGTISYALSILLLSPERLEHILESTIRLSFLHIFGIACAKTVFETAIPFFVTRYLGGNIIHFFENTALFCGISLGGSFLFILLIKHDETT